MSEADIPIAGRVVAIIEAQDVANGGMIVQTGGSTFTVGSEVDVYLGYKERYTLEEAWEILGVALREAEGSTGKRFDEVLLRITNCPYDCDRWAAKSSGTAWVYGPDPLAALRALTATAKPCPCKEAVWNPRGSYDGFWAWASGDYSKHDVRPGEPCPDCGAIMPPAPLKSPDDMTKAECEAELNAAEGVAWQVAPYETGEGGSYSWRWAIIVGAELLPKPAYSQRGYASEDWALRYAVRSLRAHFVDTLEGRESVVG